uniref:Uncharacterized protein n=1 Tax=Arundo donax TaxID=35708 RepID=A0A0A9GV24_ARUDO
MVIVLIVVEGRGKDKYINGSNVTETFLQMGQTNVDLYWPWQISTMIESFRAKWLPQYSSATSSSGRPSESFASEYGLHFTRFKSSWSPSNRKARSSCESC